MRKNLEILAKNRTSMNLWDYLPYSKIVNFLKIVYVSKSAYFALYHSRQINYIVHFCCTDIGATALAIDTTFYLCNLCVTDTTHRNQRLIKLEAKKNPVFLESIMFHFRKNYNVFTRFAIELLHVNKDVRKLKQVAAIWSPGIYLSNFDVRYTAQLSFETQSSYVFIFYLFVFVSTLLICRNSFAVFSSQS